MYEGIYKCTVKCTNKQKYCKQILVYFIENYKVLWDNRKSQILWRTWKAYVFFSHTILHSSMAFFLEFYVDFGFKQMYVEMYTSVSCIHLFNNFQKCINILKLTKYQNFEFSWNYGNILKTDAEICVIYWFVYSFLATQYLFWLINYN